MLQEIVFFFPRLKEWRYQFMAGMSPHMDVQRDIMASLVGLHRLIPVVDKESHSA